MKKNLLLTTVMLSSLMIGSGVVPQAQEPIYDEEGNLVLDEELIETPSTSNTSDTGALYDENDNLILDQEEPVKETNDMQVIENSAKKSIRTASIKTEETTSPETQGVMLPSSHVYVAANGNANLITKGSKPIEKVDISYGVGLPDGAWKLNSDNTISFDNEKLKYANNGSYNFNITFNDGTTSLFELKIMADLPFEDYWQQNLEVFSKDTGSDMYRDLHLTTSAQTIELLSLMIEVDERNDSGSVVVPQSAYSIVGNSIIISKYYLKTLPITPRARITLTYGSGLVRDFSLEITDKLGNDNTSQINGCDI